MFVRQGLGYSTERAWALEPSASLRGSFEAEIWEKDCVHLRPLKANFRLKQQLWKDDDERIILWVKRGMSSSNKREEYEEKLLQSSRRGDIDAVVVSSKQYYVFVFAKKSRARPSGNLKTRHRIFNYFKDLSQQCHLQRLIFSKLITVTTVLMFCLSVSEMSAKYKHTYMYLCFTGNYECLFYRSLCRLFPK